MDGMNKEKWKALSKEDKIQFIKDYYTIHIVVGLIVLFVVGGFIVDRITYREPIISAVLINVVTDDFSLSTAPFDDFLAKNGYEQFDGAVSLNSQFYIYTAEESEDSIQTSGQHLEILHAQLVGGVYDLAFGQGAFFKTGLVDGEALMDLRKVLPAQLLEEHKDILVYCEGEDVDEPFPCALLLEDNAWLKEAGYYKKCYVGIPVVAENWQVGVEFLEYVLGR